MVAHGRWEAIQPLERLGHLSRCHGRQRCHVGIGNEPEEGIEVTEGRLGELVRRVYIGHPLLHHIVRIRERTRLLSMLALWEVVSGEPHPFFVGSCAYCAETLAPICSTAILTLLLARLLSRGPRPKTRLFAATPALPPSRLTSLKLAA